MNVTRYYPFERNRYFYGKLLTVRDFESEQKYFSNKRRLLNRLLHGTGVVAGLHVVAVDDKSISVEAGLALDHLGREIIIPSPTTLKLSTIEGFSNNEYAKSVYLCLAYQEKGKEPVHSVANSSTRSEEVSEYNRILESYKLFIQEEPPQPGVFESASLLEETSIVYQDEHVRILHSTPRYVQANEKFEGAVKIEKSLQAPKVRMELEIGGDHFELVKQGNSERELDRSTNNKITYIEPQNEQITDEVIRYVVRPKGDVFGLDELKLQFKSDSSFLVKGEQTIALEANVSNIIKIVEHDPKAQLLSDYFSRTLDQSVKATAESCIYLAKIHLLQMGSTYMIEKVDEVPFNEYVQNPSFLHQLELATAWQKQGKVEQKSEQAELFEGRSFSVQSELKELKAKEKPHFRVNFKEAAQQFEFSLGLPNIHHVPDEVRTGVVEIKLGQRGGLFKSKAFYSEEIEHGLGTDGSILIMTGIEESNSGVGKHSTQQIYFGDADVFKDSEYESGLSNISIGSVLHMEKGTFQIGVRAQGTVAVPQIRIRWWAIKKTAVDTVERKPLPQSEIAATTDQKLKS